MTITVRIMHEGPENHDIEVVTANPVTGLVHGPAYRLSYGMSATLYVHREQGIAIRELAIENEPAAVGGIGEVGVSITPHGADLDNGADSEGGEP